MPTPQTAPNSLTSLNILAWGLTSACCILSAWGWLNDGLTLLSIFFAVVFALFQLGVNRFAEWLRILGWARPATLIGGVCVMIAFGLFSHISLKLAWADAERMGLVPAQSPLLMSSLLLVLPFTEPFLFWLKRLLSEPPSVAGRCGFEPVDQPSAHGSGTRADNQPAEQTSAAATLGRPAGRPLTTATLGQPAGRPGAKGLQLAGAAVVASVAMAGHPAPAIEQPVEMTPDRSDDASRQPKASQPPQSLAPLQPMAGRPTERDERAVHVGATLPGEQSAAALAHTLLASGVSQREVSRRTGLSRYAVGRIAIR